MCLQQLIINNDNNNSISLGSEKWREPIKRRCDPLLNSDLNN